MPVPHTLAFAALLLLAACNDPTDSAADGFRFRAQLATNEVDPAELDAAQVTAARRRIEFRGRITAPCALWTVDGELVRTGTSLAVVVRETGTPCRSVAAPFIYDGVIGGLEPGTYHLQILHRGVGTEIPPRTVYWERVTVR